MEQMTIEEYLQALSSKAPVPGGGGTSALGGALGIALAGMVESLTMGKKRYAQYEEDIRRLHTQSQSLQEEFRAFIGRDAEAFEPLSRAYRMPKETREQREEREQAVESAVVEAARVPMEIARKAADSIQVLEELLEKGSVLALSDTGAAAAFLRASLSGAVLNVYINTKQMKDREMAQEMNREAMRLQEEGCKRLDRIYREVMERLLSR